MENSQFLLIFTCQKRLFVNKPIIYYLPTNDRNKEAPRPKITGITLQYQFLNSSHDIPIFRP